MTDSRTTPADSSSRRGFQPASRRRNRIALGVLLAAVAIGGNLFVYAGLDNSEPAVQVVRDVPAGEQLTADMLRTVEVDADSTVNLVHGDQLGSLVGSYAKVRLVSGSLVTPQALQPTPLVSAGSSIVAIQVGEGTLPVGVRERAAIVLVIPGEAGPTSIAARVVGLPMKTASALGVESLSVEVDANDAATVAAADDVRVVLVEPTDDPSVQQDGEP